MVNIYQRKELRHKLMAELYNHYFETKGTALHLTKEVLQSDKERDLAYQYLTAKGLINLEQQGNQNFYLKPSESGIDYVESNK